MDALMLSRIQFAVTVAFHYIYPPLSIGLGVLLVMMEGMYLATKDKDYLQLTKFWTKIFSLIFAIGVATGVVMEFEFGTNWATYSRYVGDVFGSALAAEGIFAFFLESGFLAVVLFGWDKVKPWFHFFSTCMVALGAHFSAIWIVVAGSWMQTPAGFRIEGEGMHARAVITDFWAMVFNPSSVERLSHVIMGCWQAGAFLVISVSAYYLLKKNHTEMAMKALRLAVILAVVASVGQLVTGHFSAHVVAQHQPAKLAAFEGHYPKQAPADLYLFGWVDENKQAVRFGLKIPGLLSWLVNGDAKAPVMGLNAFPEEDRPPVNIVFQAYHFMILIGLWLIGLSLVTAWFVFRNEAQNHPWLLRILVVNVLLPQIANQLGWMAAEVGRQPWIVYGLLRTTEALSKTVTANMVMGSLVLFTVIYFLLFGLFLYLLDKKIRTGPAVAETPAEPWPLGHRADL